LGFDIILDSDLRPILLEVNHAPSFATDSPLDYEIKHKLFVDMFNLLGLTLDRKKKKLLNNYTEKINKTMNRLTKQQKYELKVQREKEF